MTLKRQIEGENMLYQKSLEARMDAMMERNERLREENSRLKEKAEKSESDTHEFVAYFQSELERKDAAIARLSATLEKTQLTSEKKVKETIETCETKLSEASNMQEELKTTQGKEISELKSELGLLMEFKVKKDALQEKLDNVDARLEEQRRIHEEEMRKQEMLFIEKTAKQQKEMDELIEVINARARQKAQEGLTSDVRKIIADNQRMGEELKFQIEAGNELQKEKNQLEEENKKLKMTLDLAREKEEHCAQNSLQREAELQKVRQELSSNQKSLQSVTKERTELVGNIKSSFERKMGNLELEVAGLKQLLKLKNKELNNIRKLAKVILEQRTSTEQFFLQALEQVKREVKKERAEGHHLPSLNSMASNSRVSAYGNSISLRASDGKVHFEELPWSDRERVLRLLFAKINGSSNQRHDVLKDVVVGSSMILD